MLKYINNCNEIYPYVLFKEIILKKLKFLIFLVIFQTSFLIGCVNNYVVTFYFDEIANKNDSNSVEFKVKSGKTIINLPFPDKENSTFAGWFTDPYVFENEFTANTKVESNLTLYAKWIPDIIWGPDTVPYYLRGTWTGIVSPILNSINSIGTSYTFTANSLIYNLYADEKLSFSGSYDKDESYTVTDLIFTPINNNLPNILDLFPLDKTAYYPSEKYKSGYIITGRVVEISAYYLVSRPYSLTIFYDEEENLFHLFYDNYLNKYNFLSFFYKKE